MFEMKFLYFDLAILVLTVHFSIWVKRESLIKKGRPIITF